MLHTQLFYFLCMHYITDHQGQQLHGQLFPQFQRISVYKVYSKQKHTQNQHPMKNVQYS